MKPSIIRRDTVRGLLAGLGCEDIAVKCNHAVGDIRAMIAELRREYVLIHIVRQARPKAKRK